MAGSILLSSFSPFIMMMVPDSMRRKPQELQQRGHDAASCVCDSLQACTSGLAGVLGRGHRGHAPIPGLGGCLSRALGLHAVQVADGIDVHAIPLLRGAESQKGDSQGPKPYGPGLGQLRQLSRLFTQINKELSDEIIRLGLFRIASPCPLRTRRAPTRLRPPLHTAS